MGNSSPLQQEPQCDGGPTAGDGQYRNQFNPIGANVAQLRKRPWWTRLVPNVLLKALGLVADLVQMATDSEQPAERLQYISEHHPEQLFFKRFSANTGIHGIQLDDWRAVTGADGVGVIEERTQTYLQDDAIQHELTQAAQKLVEVYIQRHEDARPPSEITLNEESINLSISVVVNEGESRPAALTEPSRALYPNRTAEAIPSLITGTESTQSPGPSPPRTPEPHQRPSLMAHPTHTENKEILQGQGQQFRDSILPSSPPPDATSTVRSPSPRTRRAATMPVSFSSDKG